MTENIKHVGVTVKAILKDSEKYVRLENKLEVKDGFNRSSGYKFSNNKVSRLNIKQLLSYIQRHVKTMDYMCSVPS